MGRFVTLSAALALLTACEGGMTATAPGPDTSDAPSPSAAAAAGIPPRSGFTTYVCANGQIVRQQEDNDDDLPLPRGDRITLVEIDGQTIPMLEAVSASGVRHIGGGWQWWTRGLQTGTLSPLARGEAIASAPGTDCRSTG